MSTMTVETIEDWNSARSLVIPHGTCARVNYPVVVSVVEQRTSSSDIRHAVSVRRIYGSQHVR